MSVFLAYRDKNPSHKGNLQKKGGDKFVDFRRINNDCCGYYCFS